MKLQNYEDVQFLFAHQNYEYEVEAFYSLNRVRFSVLWDNRNETTGETMNFFNLSCTVFCNKEDYRERIEESIKLGEVDENKDVELYLYLRDFTAEHYIN